MAALDCLEYGDLIGPQRHRLRLKLGLPFRRVCVIDLFNLIKRHERESFDFIVQYKPIVVIVRQLDLLLGCQSMPVILFECDIIQIGALSIVVLAYHFELLSAFVTVEEVIA